MEIEWDREIGELGSLRARYGASAGLPNRLSRQYRHSFDVPCHGDQVPFPSHRVQSTQQELPEAHHGFDDAKYRLHCLLSQAIEFASLSRFEPVLHPIHGAGRLGQRWGLAESVFPMRMMFIASGGEQGFDIRLLATLNIACAEVPVVGQQMS